MSEVAIDGAVSSRGFRERVFGTRHSRQHSAVYGYALTLIALGAGWLLRDDRLVNPQDGLGYWLGVAGGGMMLALLLYPLRKRIRVLRVLGGTAQWFRAHMILGILGPLLILYHSNFHLGSINSRIALYCMLLVAGSGVVGRHLYARIHRGLYGRKTSLGELRKDLEKSLAANAGLATLLPKLTARLESLATQLQGDSITKSLRIGESLGWTFRKHIVRISLSWAARRELKDRARQSPTVARDYRKLRKASNSYIRHCISLTGRVAQFTLYERMFSLWHVLHLPLFFMLVISALIHVLAVHMY